MGTCLLVVGMLMVSAPQDTKLGSSPTSTGSSRSDAYTVEKALAEIEKLRVDAQRSLNHYATEGMNTSTDRLKVKLRTGPYRYEEMEYLRRHDKTERALRDLQVCVRKIIPTEPISKDVRGFFGDDKLPASAVHERRRLWIEQRMKDYDDAWLDAEDAIVTFARAFTPRRGKKGPLVAADYGLGWERAPGGQPGSREKAAQLTKVNLHAELVRRLTSYFDDAREAWLLSQSDR